MTAPSTFRPRAIAAATVLALLVTVAGCFNPFDPTVRGRGLSTPPPIPKDPQNTLRLFEWAYNNRDYPQYRTLFTDDYRFAFGALDTNGNRYRGDLWTRIDEIESTRKLFEGGDVHQPAASQINLALDKSFALFADDRPNKNDPLRRKTIRTQVVLNIVTVDGAAQNIQGKARFFFVRGDSAVIPVDLGLKPDINRWYIERWEDETYAPSLMAGASARLLHDALVEAFGPPIGPAAAAAAERAGRTPAAGAVRVHPTRAAGIAQPPAWTTWGGLKADYR